MHVVCNNAGVGAGTVPSWNSTLDDWRWVLGVNLMGAIHGVRTFLPIMIEQGTEGHIVNTASLAGLISGGSTVYAVSKFGVVALSEGVYLELRQGGFKPSIRSSARASSARTSRSERNQPADSGPGQCAADRTRLRRLSGVFEEQVRNGLCPRRVGELVLEAIREDRFYVLTHPEANPAIEQRTQRMLAGENPAPLPPPGFDVLLQRLAAASERQS